jgi:hypothetical protein
VESDQSPLHLHTDRRTDTTHPWVTGIPLPPSAASGTLGDHADGLIRALFACGFTSAAVQGRHDVGADLSDQLTTLIGTLDEAIRGIRHALSASEAA